MACISGECEFDDDICGIIYQSKKSGNRITIWTRNSKDDECRNYLSSYFKNVMQLTADSRVNYSGHNDTRKGYGGGGGGHRY